MKNTPNAITHHPQLWKFSWSAPSTNIIPLCHQMGKCHGSITSHPLYSSICWVDILSPTLQPAPIISSLLQFKSHEGWRWCWIVFPAAECFHFNVISTFAKPSQVPNPLCQIRGEGASQTKLWVVPHFWVRHWIVVAHNAIGAISQSSDLYLKHT